MSIIYGIVQIMGPSLQRNGLLSEALSCIGALNLYELALLGTLAFVVVRQRVTDDALSLLLLIPLFLVGSGIALDTIASESPLLAFGIGAGCVLLGGGKLAVLTRAILVPFGGLALAGMMLVVLWNSLAGTSLSWLFAEHPAWAASKRPLWLGSMLLLLVAGILVMADIRRPERTGVRGAPFLRTRPMVVLFAMVLLAAAGAHLWAIAYQFDVRYALGDFVMLATLGLFLQTDALLRLGLDKGERELAGLFGCAPMILTLMVWNFGGFSTPFQWGLEMIGHPCAVFAVAGACMVAMARRTRWFPCWGIAGAYAFAALLSFGAEPGVLSTLNWRLCAGLIPAAAMILGIVLRRADLCAIAVIVGTGGLSFLPGFGRLAVECGLTVTGAAAGLGGVGLLLVAIVFRRESLALIAAVGAAGAAGCALDSFGPGLGIRDAIVLVLLAVLALAAWRRLRWPVPVWLLAVPALERAWVLFCALSAWRYVVLSFLLLAAGAWASARKGRKLSGEAAARESDDSAPGVGEESSTTTHPGPR